MLFVSGHGFFCFTMEPPWRDNRSNVSCIPPGEYKVVPRHSKKYGHHFHVTNVEGRSFILEHSGNLAGDKSKGLITHSWGCLLFGMAQGWMRGQRAIFRSKEAIYKYMKLMDGKEHNLKIREAY
jgi:hypothetical protein